MRQSLKLLVHNHLSGMNLSAKLLKFKLALQVLRNTRRQSIDCSPHCSIPLSLIRNYSSQFMMAESGSTSPTRMSRDSVFSTGLHCIIQHLTQSMHYCMTCLINFSG